MMEDRRSWIDDVTERQFLIFLSSHSKIQNLFRRILSEAGSTILNLSRHSREATADRQSLHHLFHRHV